MLPKEAISRQFFTLASYYVDVDFEQAPLGEEAADEDGPEVCEVCVLFLKSFCEIYQNWKRLEVKLNKTLEAVESVHSDTDF